MTKQNNLKILHLSDFHFSIEHRWDADRVLNGIPGAIEELSASGLKPDIVAITGDIAQQGSKEDYKIASEWISDYLLPVIPQMPKENLFVVPGNHDVERGRVRRSIQLIQEDMLANGQEVIADYFQGPDRDDILSRLTEYVAFANDVSGVSTKFPWWATARSIRGSQVLVYGLCSSWASYKPEEQGDLLIGRYQLNQLLKDDNIRAIKVALLHHPFSYFREFDGEESSARIRQHCTIVLRGHLHTEASQLVETPDSRTLELACGSAYAGSEYSNSFHLIEIDPNTLETYVHYRVWHRNKWIPDRNAYRAGSNGVATFSLKAPKRVSTAMDNHSDKQIIKLLADIQGRSKPVSIIATECLVLAQELQDNELAQFCQNELSGWPVELMESEDDTLKQGISYRIIDIYISLHPFRLDLAAAQEQLRDEIDVIEFLRKKPDKFSFRKLFIDGPLAWLEEKVEQKEEKEENKFRGLKLIQLKLPSKELIFDVVAEDDQAPHIYAYAEPDAISKILESVRQRLTKMLLALYRSFQ